MNLCQDVIYEILNLLDSRTSASLLSVNRYLFNMTVESTVMQQRRLLATELRKTGIKTRKYYRGEILDLQVGDRITDDLNNYKVFNIKKRIGILEGVDMLGRSLNYFIPIKLYKKTWVTTYYKGPREYYFELYYGIIKHYCGPQIKHVDDIYLNYITKPQDHCHLPELNMMVTVYHHFMTYEYVIIQLCIHEGKETMTLKLLEGNVKELLHVVKRNNKWVIKNFKYKILYFGSWKN